jgi:DNA-binding LytR/AlgR family response regulator
MNPPAVTALIADDEEAPRAQLAAALRSAWPGLTLVAECANGVDAWDAWLEHEPQVCFLDIRMLGRTGIDFPLPIGGPTPVVFVTAFGDHALAAFDAGAVDYVMKPVDPERLAQAVGRLKARLQPASPLAAASGEGLQNLLAQLAGQLGRRPTLDVIQAGVGKEVRMIRTDEVIYFEADSRYTRVVHEGGEALIRTPLKELLAQLDDTRFWQVHRSVIVNQRWIAAAVRVDEGQMHLTLRGRDDKLPVSRHFQGLFKGQ